MLKHPKGSEEARCKMHTVRGVILQKGSEEAKAFMKALREKRKPKEINNISLVNGEKGNTSNERS